MTRAQVPQESPSPLSKPLAALLSLLTLVTFTQAQSLYEMLAGNRELLALRLESNWQLVEIVLVFNWLPALLLFGLWWALDGTLRAYLPEAADSVDVLRGDLSRLRLLSAETPGEAAGT